MKKFYLGCLAFMVMAMTSVMFTACGSDDDDSSVSNTPLKGLQAESLVGTWQVYMIKGWGTIDGRSVSATFNVSPKDTYVDDEQECDRYEFSADGSFQLYYYIDGAWKKDGSGYKYKVSDGKFYIGHGTNLTEEYTVNKISSNELVFTVYDEDGDEKVYTQYYTKRVE